MMSSIAATTVSGALVRICVCLWGVVANTETRSLRFSASAAAARTVRISSSVAPGWPPVPTTKTAGHSQCREVGSEVAVHGVHLDHDVRGLVGDIRAEQPSAARTRMSHLSRRNWVRGLLLAASSSIAIG